MNILYCALSYIPSRSASSVQVMRTCSAYARRGHRIRLLAKRNVEPAAAGLSVHAYYGVNPTFEVELVPRPKRRGGDLMYGAGVAARIVRDQATTDLVYCRDLYGATFATTLGMPVVLESHGVPEAEWQRIVWRRIVRARRFLGLVAMSNALRAELDRAELLPTNAPIVIARNATEPWFDDRVDHELSSPPRIGYIGSLYPNRGVEIVLELARRMPGCRFELVGGSEADLARWRSMNLSANVVLHGFQPPGALGAFYARMDVLLMPYPLSEIRGSSGGADSSKYCSPMKMFEYMASGVAMIASDLPVLQEVLVDGTNALIAPSGNVDAWQSAIERLLADRELRIGIGGRALADLRENFTPDARAARVFDGLGLS